MPYSWLSEALDLTQMVIDVRKALKITIFIIPNNFCFNNIAKKLFPGTPRGHALLLAVRGSGPQPDGHGQMPNLFSGPGGQAGSNGTTHLALALTVAMVEILTFY